MTLRKLREFLGITGYCHIWIPGYGDLAQPLYKLITETRRPKPTSWFGPQRLKRLLKLFKLLSYRLPLRARPQEQSLVCHWSKAMASLFDGECYYCFAWCRSWNSSTLATSCKELTHWKRLWCWEGLGAGREGNNRGWDGWMASPTQWTWVWVNSGSWWWTGRPGVLRFMGSQRVGHNWAN